MSLSTISATQNTAAVAAAIAVAADDNCHSRQAVSPESSSKIHASQLSDKKNMTKKQSQACCLSTYEFDLFWPIASHWIPTLIVPFPLQLPLFLPLRFNAVHQPQHDEFQHGSQLSWAELSKICNSCACPTSISVVSPLQVIVLSFACNWSHFESNNPINLIRRLSSSCLSKLDSISRQNYDQIFETKHKHARVRFQNNSIEKTKLDESSKVQYSTVQCSAVQCSPVQSSIAITADQIGLVNTDQTKPTIVVIK